MVAAKGTVWVWVCASFPLSVWKDDLKECDEFFVKKTNTKTKNFFPKFCTLEVCRNVNSGLSCWLWRMTGWS